MTGHSIFPKAFCVTGTDTLVGKTVISAMLMLGIDAQYWKPVQSGLDPLSDTTWIQEHTGLPGERFLPERYVLSQPFSPHLSARIDGVNISLFDFTLPAADPGRSLIVEGAGGLMVPLNSRHLIVDLIDHLALPVLLVCRSTLGTINHTLLSLSELSRRGIPVLGIVMNGPPNIENRRAIEHFGNVPVLAEVPTLPTLDRQSLQQAFHSYFEVTDVPLPSQPAPSTAAGSIIAAG